MANHYSEMSAFVEIPAEKIESSKKIWERIIGEYEHYSGEHAAGEYHGFDYEYRSGIWIHHEEYIDVESVIDCVQQFLDEAEIDIPFYGSWSYGCSKPRIDEFGGGAMCLRRDKPPVVIDAMSHVQKIVREEGKSSNEN